MTDAHRPPRFLSPLRHPTRPNLPPTVWLVGGVLAVADEDLPGALHELADNANLRHVEAIRDGKLAGIILRNGFRLAWSVSLVEPDQVQNMVDQVNPDASYRLLTLTMTRLMDDS